MPVIRNEHADLLLDYTRSKARAKISLDQWQDDFERFQKAEDVLKAYEQSHPVPAEHRCPSKFPPFQNDKGDSARCGDVVGHPDGHHAYFGTDNQRYDWKD